MHKSALSQSLSQLTHALFIKHGAYISAYYQVWQGKNEEGMRKRERERKIETMGGRQTDRDSSKAVKEWEKGKEIRKSGEGRKEEREYVAEKGKKEKGLRGGR